jgi:hypothetical protein
MIPGGSRRVRGGGNAPPTRSVEDVRAAAVDRAAGSTAAAAGRPAVAPRVAVEASEALLATLSLGSGAAADAPYGRRGGSSSPTKVRALRRAGR